MVSNWKNELIIICFDRRVPIVFSFRRFPLKRWNASVIVNNADNSTVLLQLFKTKIYFEAVIFLWKKAYINNSKKKNWKPSRLYKPFYILQVVDNEIRMRVRLSYLLAVSLCSRSSNQPVRI